jgi:predicted PhzF superfamily epimerase YddE/YHI9
MKLEHYTVFAAAKGGGKHIALTEADHLSTEEMQTIARESGAPLTGFILGEDDSGVQMKFFTPSKEKPESDSGALVVAEHRWRKGLVEVLMRANMNGDILAVSGVGHGGHWFSEQGTTSVLQLEIPYHQVLECLNLNSADLHSEFQIGTAGANKINIVVPVKNSSVLDVLKPDLEAIKTLNIETKTNGLIVFTPGQTRGTDVDLRFFAPAKGILEDNAGSFTIASLCGFLVESQKLEGKQQLSFSQGFAFGKPSKLEAKFLARDGIASDIRVGGEVVRIEP